MRGEGQVSQVCKGQGSAHPLWGFEVMVMMMMGDEER